MKLERSASAIDKDKTPLKLPFFTFQPTTPFTLLFRSAVHCSVSLEIVSAGVTCKLKSKHKMGDEKDAFYVVRKGDVIGVYKNLSDLQALLRTSIGEPAISVFKGYRLTKESEEYLASHGLKNAMYSMDFSDVRDDLFGTLIPCPFRQPGSSKDKIVGKNVQEKRMQMELVASPSFAAAGQQKLAKLDNFLEAPPISSYPSPYMQCSCILEFDGASKGNPGLAGAGAVLRAADGSMVFRLREGVGVATNNVAEYRGVILGLRYALEKGFKHIKVKGDSKLVCMQTQGIWKCKNQNMAELSKIVKELKDQFMSFQINHMDRESNTEADAQANLAVYLKSKGLYLVAPFSCLNKLFFSREKSNKNIFLQMAKFKWNVT
ncbi:hypothetical protein KY284_014909 [Solanum tuberosum]|nr:hypothetical protein KY284_014909 [Solanum tuberosum]